MPDISLASECDRTAIAEFVCQHPYGQVHHTWEGSRLFSLDSGRKWLSSLALMRVDGQLVGVMPVTVTRARGLPVSLCRSIGGPLLTLSLLREGWQAFLEWLVDYARSQRCCRVGLDSGQALRIADEDAPDVAALLASCDRTGFCRTSQGGGTYWVSLDEEERLLQSLTTKCRRDVRKALREGVEVTHRTDSEALQLFMDNYFLMCRRKGIPAQSSRYFLEGIRPLLDANLAEIYIASYDGEPRNLALVMTTGLPRYWRGASSPGAFEKGVPPTGQVLHFGIACRMYALGRHTYDLGGAPGPDPQPAHPNYGVWRFKHEFGGSYVTCLGEFERVLSPFRNRFLSLGTRVNRFLHRVRG